jgi:signal transduction histidine kinase
MVGAMETQDYALAVSERAFEALSEAVLAVTRETDLDSVLHKLVHTVRDLIGARYAALGIPDGQDGFERFLTSGMSDELIDRIGPLPRTHGLLAAILEDTASYRTDDIRDDQRFEWWPRHHPEMTSFLGVPIVSKGAVLGAFYLTNEDSTEFSENDQRLVELFAAHAATAIENAQLFERSRELSVIEERNRLARDLHDSVAQVMFSLSLTAEAAARTEPTDATRKVAELAKQALDEMRQVVFELRPADLAAEGFVATVTKHATVLSRVFGQAIAVDVRSEATLDPDVELQLFRITQEALSNALKHARASKVTVTIDGTHLEIIDDGVGFDAGSPALRARHLGLTSMEERAKQAGGKARIESSPGSGTMVVVDV